MYLEEHEPLKETLPHENHALYVTEAFSKAIMKRSYLEKLYFKKKTPGSPSSRYVRIKKKILW